MNPGGIVSNGPLNAKKNEKVMSKNRVGQRCVAQRNL
jgi:hypothetical protein